LRFNLKATALRVSQTIHNIFQLGDIIHILRPWLGPELYLISQNLILINLLTKSIKYSTQHANMSLVTVIHNLSRVICGKSKKNANILRKWPSIQSPN
jgi:hypothetical protein